MSEETTHQPLPVLGYTPQPNVKVELVNSFKQLEEIVLRNLDLLAAVDWVDKRWLAIGRTDLEKAFMAINRSVFAPTRVTLPLDGATSALSKVDGPSKPEMSSPT